MKSLSRTVLAAVAALTTAVAPATAAADPGAVTASQPISHAAAIAGVRAEKISYESTLMDGSPTTVTGVIYEPSVAWDGPGERPTIIFAPGTRGAGDQCAPSNADQAVGNLALGPAQQVTLNMNYEYAFYQYAAQQGVRVAEGGPGGVENRVGLLDVVDVGVVAGRSETYEIRGDHSHALLRGVLVEGVLVVHVERDLLGRAQS